MARYRGGWAPYVPVATRRRQAAREMEKLRKKGLQVEPVVITGRSIATTFWGKAWCKNLESYRDFENRIPRGRTYVRNGSVVDLQIGSKEVQAKVSGSSIYTVKVNIGALPQTVWQAICDDCSVGIDSLVELLQGRFNKGVMDRLCRQDNGLFPKPSEINFSCSCPDYASMCKHIAAVLYGIGARLDEKPELLFFLRAVDHNDLLANIDTAVPLAKQGPETGKLLETDDISQLFGLDMAEGDVGDVGQEKPQPVAKTTGKSSPAKMPKHRSTNETKQEDNVWREIESLISSCTASGYAKATDKLRNLRDSAMNTKKMTMFSQRLDTLRVRHKRKSRFIKDLNAFVALPLEGSVISKPDVEVQVKQDHKDREKELLTQMLKLVKVAGFETVEDFLGDQEGRSTVSNKEMKLFIKYQSKDGKKNWSGRGRKPNWVKEYLEGGGKLEQLEIS